MNRSQVHILNEAGGAAQIETRKRSVELFLVFEGVVVFGLGLHLWIGCAKYTNDNSRLMKYTKHTITITQMKI